jgi:hypothetical protein
MKRVVQWANFRGTDGEILSRPMVMDADAGGLTMPGPNQDMELVSVTPASMAWMDEDGSSIVDTAEDPETKEARQQSKAVLYEKKAKDEAAKEARKAQVLALAAGGMSPRAIAEKVGTTTWVVNLWLRLNAKK